MSSVKVKSRTRLEGIWIDVHNMKPCQSEFLALHKLLLITMIHRGLRFLSHGTNLPSIDLYRLSRTDKLNPKIAVKRESLVDVLVAMKSRVYDSSNMFR
jgi:hypothetical protein